MLPDDEHIEYREIPRHQGYMAGSDGSIWSCRGRRDWHRLSPFADKKGYLYVTVRVNGKSPHKSVHSLVALAFHGECPDGHECRHKNGKNDDNRADNVCYGTPKDNALDKVSHGTHQFGASVNGAKLNDSLVLLIKSRVGSGESQRQVAISLGISPATVCCLLKGKTWKHVV